MLDHKHTHTLSWVYFHLFSPHFVIPSEKDDIHRAMPLPTRIWFLFTSPVHFFSLTRSARSLTLFLFSSSFDCITFRFISQILLSAILFYFILIFAHFEWMSVGASARSMRKHDEKCNFRAHNHHPNTWLLFSTTIIFNVCTRNRRKWCGKWMKGKEA